MMDEERSGAELPTDLSEAEARQAKQAARAAGISEHQAKQLIRASDGDASDLDSAAAAAARWS